MTIQCHEILILNGQETTMIYFPPFPENDKRIIDFNDILSINTSCWRNYVGTWAIEEYKLYLVKLTGRYKLAEKSPIFADWFSGMLRVPLGELKGDDCYEQELRMIVEKGVILKFAVIYVENKNLGEWEAPWLFGE